MFLKYTAFAVTLGVILALTGSALAGFDEGVAALQIGEYAVAFDAWQKSAETGDARSQYGLGYLYQFGLGTAPDNTRAKAWYEKAAAQNEPDALFALGLMYEMGSAGKKDRTEAMVLYSQAAATGKSPDAEFALGRIYWRGQGVPRNEKEALIWLTKAANDGQPGAQYMLGEAYEVGGTLKQDKVEAYYWYSAALSGDAVVLRETDPEFDPKAALEVLEKHMSPREIEAAKAKLKKTPPPVQGQPAVAAPAAPTAPAKSG